jgi:hypothetical protein
VSLWSSGDIFQLKTESKKVEKLYHIAICLRPFIAVDFVVAFENVKDVYK